MEDIPYNFIVNHERVTHSFGHWPSFHDSEVVSIRLDRDQGRDLTGPMVTMVFFLFRLEVAEEDPRRNKTLTTLQFRDVENLKLSDFNHQNAINGIALSRYFCERLKCEVFGVKIAPGFGLESSFQCREIEVLSVEPYVPK